MFTYIRLVRTAYNVVGTHFFKTIYAFGAMVRGNGVYVGLHTKVRLFIESC